VVKVSKLSLTVALKMEDEMLARMKELEDDFGAEMAAELLELFLFDTGRRISSLSHLIERHDVKALCAETHSMKGSCGNIGAERMANLCRQLEQCLTLKTEPKLLIDRLRSLTLGLEREFLMIKSALNAETDTTVKSCATEISSGGSGTCGVTESSAPTGAARVG